MLMLTNSLIKNYKYINIYFGEIIDSMKNDLLRNLLSENDTKYLKEFNDILECLENEVGLDKLINRYKTKYKNNFERFDSLLSEIRAGYFLQNSGFPVEFLSDLEWEGPSPDIRTKIDNIDAYIEVKRIKKFEFEENKIKDELNKLEIPYALRILISESVYSAAEVAKEVESKLADLTLSSFPLDLDFKYGNITIDRDGVIGIYGVGFAYSVFHEKRDESDSAVTERDLERNVESRLNDALGQLLNKSGESDLLFVLIDNHDTYLMDDYYIFNKFYGGEASPLELDFEILPKIIEAEKSGWGNFLKKLNFIPTTHFIDFTKKPGWIFYSEYADHLNGIFYISGRIFKYNEHHTYLNPFVNTKRNDSNLQYIFQYHC